MSQSTVSEERVCVVCKTTSRVAVMTFTLSMASSGEEYALCGSHCLTELAKKFSDDEVGYRNKGSSCSVCEGVAHVQRFDSV